MGLTPQVGVWIEGVGEVDMIILDFIVIGGGRLGFPFLERTAREGPQAGSRTSPARIRRPRFTYDDVMNGDFAREVPISVAALRRLVPETGLEDAHATVKNAGFLDILSGYLPSYHLQR